LILRPHVRDTLTPDPFTDRQGWRHPRRLGAMTFMRAIPGLASQFKPIPDEFWSNDVNSEGYTAAVIACPCGEEPTVEVGSLAECQCERFFLNLGARVLVANSPADRS
jgi:hypothetical protein